MGNKCAVDRCRNQRWTEHFCGIHRDAWKSSGEYQRSLVSPYSGKSIQLAKADFVRRIQVEERNKRHE